MDYRNWPRATLKLFRAHPLFTGVDRPVRECARAFGLAVLLAPAIARADLLINEFDVDTPSTDTAEFVELFDGGVGYTQLDDYVVVLFNGSDDASYRAFDLDGFSTDSSGYFVIGGAAAANVGLVIPNNSMQNGADAVALYTGSSVEFPNDTPLTTDNLIDAVVYETGDADDDGLLLLHNPGQPQVDENGGANGAANDSNQRCPNGSGGARNTTSFLQHAPTPGEANSCGLVSTDVSISKTYTSGVDNAGPVPVVAGASVTYIIEVTNNGPVTAQNVVVTDTLPVGLTIGSGTVGCAEDSPAVPTCSLGDLAPGESKSYRIHVTVDAGSEGQTLVNTAAVTSESADTDGSNNSAAIDLPVIAPSANLSITKSFSSSVDNDGQSPVSPGATVIYLVSVTNNGPETAENVVVKDNLPAGMTLDAVGTNGCTQDNVGVPDCGLGGLAPDTTVSYLISVTVDAGTEGQTLVNTATVASDTYDPDSFDNSTAVETRIVDSSTLNQANLSIDIVDNMDPFVTAAGSVLNYTITVDNAGPDNAENVVAIEDLPGLATIVSTSGCLNDPVAEPVCELGDIAVGSSASYSVRVTVPDNSDATIVNIVRANADTIDPDATDNWTNEETTLQSPVLETSLTQAIMLNTDDAEQHADRNPKLFSGDLELTESHGQQVIGLRFSDLVVPSGSTIESARLQFHAEESNRRRTDLVIRAEAADSAATFVDIKNNITGRLPGYAQVEWSDIPEWIAEDAGSAQQTPDLSPLIQEVVSRPGWTSGQSIAFILSGTGKRVAHSYDGAPTKAAKLALDFSAELPVVAAPAIVPMKGEFVSPHTQVVSINTAIGGATIYYTDDGSVPRESDRVYTGPFVLSVTTTIKAIAIHPGYLDSPVSSATFRFTGSGGDRRVDRLISEGDNDAENKAYRRASLDSIDLELGQHQGTSNEVGLRFTGIDIPKGAIVTGAYLQFMAEAGGSTPTDLVIHGQASTDAVAFRGRIDDIGNRPRTVAYIDWSFVPAWEKDDRGAAQRTPDLGAIVQELLDQNGWASGNAMVFLIGGGGLREAYSWESGSTNAALLHIEYSR